MEIHINSETYKLVERAAEQQHQSVEDWIDATLQCAAEETLHPEKAICDPEMLGNILKRIDRRLGKLEDNPLQHSARMVSDGAKTVAKGARHVYSKVEGQPWFEQARDNAMAGFSVLSDEIKSWFEPEAKKPKRKSKKKD